MTSTMFMHYSRDTLTSPKSSYHHHVGSIGYEPLLPSSVEQALSVGVQWKLATDGPGTLFPRTVNAGICQSCSTLTCTPPTNVRQGICKGRDGLATDKDFPWAIGSTGAPSLLIMVVFAVGTSCCGHGYHLNTDISWKMKLWYSYPPGQQHRIPDLVYSGSVILWISCHTRPLTFSVVLAAGTSCCGQCTTSIRTYPGE
jgi:hypothetical protein